MAIAGDDNGRAGSKKSESGATPARLPLPTVAHVDLALRQMHDVIADEALPDEFLKILADIDSKLGSRSDTC